ncbi:glutamate-cysteine ligase family protein [Synoicihabitans lomoniglobus]|uniref:Glutamate-cysteine ligase family protein n=1 Tax=Synoicihabitans lomoniglobus TaxID=2909285 RepID=A0AAE9ZTJ7_9BACT|nr:glutamate-cysteine ligase family protein [Opitutaceae bacterium LMO-M01]WED63852.1 glutamate-cysteine ligase family protein [Opitutaceae bacterium LMO-M01]
MKPPHLFAYFGVELEYMIVDTQTLAVRPWADRVLIDAAGKPTSDIERGRLTWSNELVAHVIELKTTLPEESLDGLAEGFAAEVAEVNQRLAAHGVCIMPTAMHPTMRPEEAVLWTHDFSEVYAAFDRIFDCRGHGWSNLQSVHLNLPFSNDAEFARLHAAIRLVLPLLPALAASSPFVEGQPTGRPDNRLAFYRHNSAKLPTLCGRVIPERVYSQADYERIIFDPIAAELAPHDPDGVLEARFSNSRGAIARFDRNSIEIRVLDIQECPAADLAVLRTIIALLRELVAETHVPLAAQQSIDVEPLRALFDATVEQGAAALVAEPTVLRACGVATPVSAGELWRQVIARLDPCATASPAEQNALAVIAAHGPLAGRMTRAFEAGETLDSIYRRLATGVATNAMFQPLS